MVVPTRNRISSTNIWQVLAENDIGKTASSWVPVRTAEATPLHVDDPDIQPISSSEFMLTWTTPTFKESRGIIASYRVYQYEENDLNKDPFSPPYSWKVSWDCM